MMRSVINRNITLLLFFMGSLISYSQKLNVDSLYSIVNNSSVKDTIRVNAYYYLADELRWSSTNDALVAISKGLALARKTKFYKGEANMLTSKGRVYNQGGDPDSAEVFYKQALKISEDHQLIESEVSTLTAMGDLYRLTSKYDEALVVFEKILSKTKANKMWVAHAGALNGKGIIHKRKGELPEALVHFQKSAALAEKEKNFSAYSIAMSNIALVYDKMNQKEKAKSIYRLLIPKLKENNELRTLANTLMNLGTVYIDEAKYDSALIYLEQTYTIAEQSNIKKILGSAGLNIGLVYMNKGNLSLAEQYLVQSLHIRREINDKSGEALVLSNLCDLYVDSDQFAKAEKYIFEAIDINIQIGDSSQLEETYLKASVIFESKKDFSNAYKYRLMYEALHEKIYNSENNRLMNEMQTKYETEKKDQQNLLLKKENDLSVKTIKQQKLITYTIILGLALTMLLAFFIFRGLKQQKKANKIISEQKREVQEQKEIIEEKQKEIVDSINYAKRIQNTILAQKEIIDEHYTNNFVLFKPKDIVSGDFYWSTTQGNYFYLAVCDSTGHGVPGAFMSLLNTGFINEAINEKHINEPGKVFDYVREKLISSVSKEGQKDGFDGLLICLDKTSGKLSYAAANNHPVLISGGELKILSKDKMPVGKGERVENFKSYSIEYKHDDVLYLYTDGFADQFGGEKGKKFKYKVLNELLLSIHTKSMDQQAQILESTFDEWKGKLEQVDDVCVLGIKI